MNKFQSILDKQKASSITTPECTETETSNRKRELMQSQPFVDSREMKGSFNKDGIMVEQSSSATQTSADAHNSDEQPPSSRDIEQKANPARLSAVQSKHLPWADYNSCAIRALKKDLFKAQASSSLVDIEASRRGAYELAANNPPEADVHFHDVLLGGLPAVRVWASGASRDRAIYYPFAVAGDSAGGALALSAAISAAQAGPAARAIVVFSPWVDMTLSAKSLTQLAAQDPIVSHASLQAMLDAYVPGPRDFRDPQLSPLFADLHNLPPMLIQVGSDEGLLDDAVSLDRYCRDAGGLVTL